MSFGFPQLDSLLKKRGGINQAAQQQQPGQFQQMPQPEAPKVDAPGLMGQMEQPMSGGFANMQPNQVSQQPQQPLSTEQYQRPQFQQAPQQQPQAGAYQQPQSDARPLGGFSSGMAKQRMFNQGQQKMNGGMPGGKLNRRRF